MLLSFVRVLRPGIMRCCLKSKVLACLKKHAPPEVNRVSSEIVLCLNLRLCPSCLENRGAEKVAARMDRPMATRFNSFNKKKASDEVQWLQCQNCGKWRSLLGSMDASIYLGNGMVSSDGRVGMTKVLSETVQSAISQEETRAYEQDFRRNHVSRIANALSITELAASAILG